MLSVYGFEGTLLILGACMLHVIISAALYRPLAVHVIIQRYVQLYLFCCSLLLFVMWLMILLLLLAAHNECST